MNTVKNLVMKENFAFWVSDEEGDIRGGEHGFYCYDTRYLNEYTWEWGGGFMLLLSHNELPDRVILQYARIENERQTAGIRREIFLGESGFREVLTITANEDCDISLSLKAGTDFRDVFEVRNYCEGMERVIQTSRSGGRRIFRYSGLGEDRYESELSFSGEPAEREEGVFYHLSMKKGEERIIRVSLTCRHPDHIPSEGMTYEAWRKSFPVEYSREADTPDRIVLRQAVDDLRALLLHMPTGPYPSAGIPWFVTAFGRDALITALMLLPYQEETAAGVLRFLSRHQGKEINPRKGEEPGKILHEIRFGEMTKRNRTPHSPYFGTVDATPLFIILLGKLYETTGNGDYIAEFRPAWEAALRWMDEYGDSDNDGFIEYLGDREEGGLAVQSWKDSDDSMHHEDGRMAGGSIVPAEVQGYAYEAFRQAALFYSHLGEQAEADRYEKKARQLKERFHSAFWLEDLKIYAMALDGDKKPLRVKNSNAGHLLWSGIVPEETAPLLAETLFSHELWSGWGIRTLGAGEVLYNPVSYHNGSVWPHDTALTARGLMQYGFREEAMKIRDALFDLAFSQHDNRLPELIAGFPRERSVPVPYPVACRPQAWDAAALIMLSRF